MTAVAIITAICLIGVIWLLIKGRRAAKKPLTLDDLNFRVQYALLNDLNAQNLKKSIDEMRERFIYERKNSHAESTKFAIECQLKHLESIERTFEFKFVEFLPFVKVVYPDLPDRSENKRGFQNRSDVDEVDATFFNRCQ